MMHMPQCFQAIFALFLLATTGQANGPSSKYTTYRGSYTNYDYGYKLLLPDNLWAKGKVPPNPNHGVRIDLNGGGSYIVSDAMYPEETSLPDVVRSEEGYAKGDCGVLEEKDTGPSSLGGLPATQLTYRCAANNTLYEEILAVRLSPKDTRIRYLLELVTRNQGEKLQRDQAALMRVKDEFFLVVLPNDYFR
jgi:hypothetical protein